ncbi:MAG: helix-turn-helix domain-containing protein [Thiolinea sp.]
MSGLIEFTAILLSGYSVFSALVLAVTHFHSEHYRGQRPVQLMGLLLLISLAGLQLMHADYFVAGNVLFSPSLYVFILFTIAPAFYLFSKPLLTAEQDFSGLQLLHFLPALFALLLPFLWSLPLAFAVGAAYLLWLARSVYALREQRSRFRLELSVLGGVFVLALLVLLLGILLPLIPEELFFSLYACAVGGAFILVSVALYVAPQMPEQVSDAARETYAVSTLGQVDCDVVLEKMQQLMAEDELYRDSRLDLQTLSVRLDIAPHQLSELVNTRLGRNFSRYIREYRVQAAQAMLLKEPDASVLSVGLSVGFTSQSNFYEAFREIAGTTPAKFRKIRQNKLA